jgi:hypothetical protein
MFYKSLLGATTALLLSTAAQAQVAVSIWTNQPAAGANATIAAAGSLGAPTATTTVNAINFNSNVGGYTIGGFLNNPAGLAPAIAGADLNNVYMLFTGQIALAAGANNFTITHDDGLQLAIAGIPGFIVDEPGPTSPVATNFIANAPSAGVYNFTLSYGEVFGAPAQLVWNFNGRPVTGSVPEPATWAMMLLGFGGIGMAMRRRTRHVSLSQSA